MPEQEPPVEQRSRALLVLYTCAIYVPEQDTSSLRPHTLVAEEEPPVEQKQRCRLLVLYTLSYIRA